MNDKFNKQKINKIILILQISDKIIKQLNKFQYKFNK